MIPQKQLNEIRILLEKSENPLFFYDDDVDGLTSYLLLRKFIDRGIGVMVRKSPSLTIDYLYKIKEHNPDIIFVIDKPLVDQEFIDKVNIPMIWIDHHYPVKRKGIKYFNPKLKNINEHTSTSYWCYKIVKENLWIAMIGMFGDYFMPNLTKAFAKEYPRLIKKINKEEIIFKSELGKLIKICDFILKGKFPEINAYIELLYSINDPYELLDKKTKNSRLIYKKYEKINKQYEEKLKEAKKAATKDKLLIYIQPSLDITFNQLLSNEMIYLYPKKIVMIGVEKENAMRLSLRSRSIKLPKLINKALEGLEGGGGGHDYACGAKVAKEDFNKFIENFRKLIS